MVSKLLRAGSLSSIVSTVAWVGLLASSNLREYWPHYHPGMGLNVHFDLDPLHFMINFGAVLLTLSLTILFAGLYLYCKDESEWSFIGLLFVPAYTLLNVSAYLSQITVLPLIYHRTFVADIYTSNAAQLLLDYVAIRVPQSVTNFMYNLGYAFLGASCIIFGRILYGMEDSKRDHGALLATGGVASLIVLALAFWGYRLFSWGVIDAVLLFSMLPLMAKLYKENR